MPLWYSSSESFISLTSALLVSKSLPTEIFLHLFRRYKLDISFFIVMHLDFQNSQNFSFAAVYVHSPLAPPSSVPKVFGTVLVVLNAHYETFACLFREHSRNPVFVVVLDIAYNL